MQRKPTFGTTIQIAARLEGLREGLECWERVRGKEKRTFKKDKQLGKEWAIAIYKRVTEWTYDVFAMIAFCGIRT